MKLKPVQPGFSMVELAVVLSIIVLVASIGFSTMGPLMQRNEVSNQLKFIRSAFIKAKANAIEFNAPVRLSVDDKGAVLAIRDADRDGSFTDGPVVVIGKSAAEGEPSAYIHTLPDPDKGGQDLPIWYQEGAFAGSKADVFPDGGFVIMPNGTVSDYSLNSRSGTFFFKSQNGENFGAVHITSMGEVKMAKMIKGDEGQGAFNGWKWFE